MKFASLALLTVAATSSIGVFAFADTKWNVNGGVTTGYNDNISYVHSNKIGDMLTHLFVGTGLTQEGKNELFDINAGLLENVYTTHSSLDNLAENLGSDFKADLNDYEHVKAQEIFTHSVDPSSLQNAFGRVNGTYSTYYNKLDLESATDITKQWKAIVRYVQTNYVFSTKLLSDSSEYNPGVSTEYDFSSMAQATINYDYRKHTFSPGESSDANTPTVGWRQYLTQQWYVDLLAGADFIHGFGEDLTKPRFGAGLTNDVDQNTQLTLKFDKQYETTPYSQDISNDWHLTLNGFHQFTSRFSGDIAFYTGQGRYVISRTTEKFIGTNISVKYSLTEHIDLTLTYGLQNSTSNSDNLADTQNTIFAGVKFAF